MKKITLKASKRKLIGRKIKTLRKQGIIPANIYGKDVKSLAIEVDSKEFKKTYKEAGETGIVEVALEKDIRPVLISNVQVHPATDEILHIDFKQVNLKEKVTAQIPVEIVGESPAEKSGVGTVVLLLQELEVEALPTDLPDKFEIDANKLTEVNQVVKVSDLKYDKDKVEVKSEGEEILVKVEEPQKEEVVVAPIAEETAVEGGEKPAEGEAAETTENKTEEKPKEEAPAK